MPVETDKLREDNATLKQLLQEQQRLNALQEDALRSHQQQLEHTKKRLARREADVALLEKEEPERQRVLRDTLSQQQTRIEILEGQLADLRRHQFGKRWEKHYNPLQSALMLFNEAEVIADDPAELSAEEEADRNEAVDQDDESIAVAAHRRQKKSPRLSLPPELPRIPCEHDLPEDEKTCGHCGEVMGVIGTEISEQLCVVPQKHFVIEHRRLKYACTCKECMKTACAPKQPLPGSQASPRLLAWVMVRKYLEGLPLYRQEKIAARDGLILPRYKLARWLIDGSDVFDPLIQALEASFFSYDIAQSDDTGIRVLKEDGRQPSSLSALWIRRGGPPGQPVVLVDYNTSKSGDSCYQLLSRFRGFLVTDGAESFNKVVNKNNLTQVLCNDHARRRFDKALNGIDKHSAKGSAAQRALMYYGKLYRIEREIKELEPGEKYQQRQQRAKPVWEMFIRWASETLAAGVAHGKTTDALNYLIKHRDGLQTYLNDGRLPISNILAEHVAKAIAIPRKNFLFCDTPGGAHASAKIFSVIETARANGHHPWKYLSVLLTELPNAQDSETVKTLLPWNLTPQEVDAIFGQYPVPD